MSNLIVCNPNKCNYFSETCESNVKGTYEHADPLCVITRSNKSADEQTKSLPSASVTHKNLSELLDISKENFAKLQSNDKSFK